MGMYAKLMSRITESSLMEEEITVRYVFMMMLAIADPQGYVVGTDVAIARRMNIPVDTLKSCLACLMSPDENSNSKEPEGRRVIDSDCERGYYLVNYCKYRDTRDEESRREYMREYMRKRRTTSDVAPVNIGKQSKHPLAKVDEEVDEEVDQSMSLRLESETTKNAPQPKPKVKKQKESDADWMLGLQSSTAYSHVNVAVEYSKAEVWIQQNPGRQCTRKFFLNWLNRAADSQRAMNAPRTPHRVLQEDQKQDPTGWREWLSAHNQPYALFQHAKSHLKDRFREGNK